MLCKLFLSKSVAVNKNCFFLALLRTGIKEFSRCGNDKTGQNIRRCVTLLIIIFIYLNFCVLFKVMESQSMIYIVSEYASQGEIFGKFFNFCIQFIRNLTDFLSSDYIAKYGRLNERAARHKFWQILSAVEYCHNGGIVHRDLKVKLNEFYDFPLNQKN